MPAYDVRHAPVLVLQHLHEDGPGHLAQWLDAQGQPWELRNTEAGDPCPDDLRGYRALAVLGGAWGANDDWPSLRQAEALIRDADRRGLPVLGHCLGGQLMARAWGGRVRTLDQPEIGWQDMRVADHPLAQAWLGPPGTVRVYQWHYDGFVEPPPGARVIAASAACAHQAFVLGPHLAMQFHIEITARKIEDWLAAPGEGYAPALARHPQSVQSPGAMRADTPHCLPASQALANHIYARWRRGWPG